MKYRCICADPPWLYPPHSWFGLGSYNYYDLMTTDDLCNLGVERVVADDAMLWLWCTGPHLAKGVHLRVMEAWGFEVVTVGFVWIKMNKGRWRHMSAAVDSYMAQPVLPGFYDGEPLQWVLAEQTLGALTAHGPGRYLFSNAEFVVLGCRGERFCGYVEPESGKQRMSKSVIYAPRGDHSAKPGGFYERVDWMYPHVEPKLELFGRGARDGWEVVGDEAPGWEGVTMTEALEELSTR